MLSLLLSALLLAPSPARADAPPEGFGSARLVDGTPDFNGCITGGGDCQEDFFRFLSHSMLEQGFTMRHHPLLTSPLVNHHAGTVLGADVATFPFAGPRQNLSGKEENTAFSPVFPHVTLGALGDDPTRPWGLGFSFLPPIEVGGASALALAGDGTYAWGDPEGTRLGVELGVSYVRALAPIVATEDQLAERDTWNNPDNLDPEQFEERCGSDVDAGASGCIDVFTMLDVSMRVGQSWHTRGGWAPFLQGGITAVNQRLYVKYDDTTWAIFALQPSVHGGLGWNPGEHLTFAVAGSAALRQANQSEEGSIGLFTTLQGAAGLTF